VNGEWLLRHLMRLKKEYPALLKMPVILSVSVPVLGGERVDLDPTLDGLWDGALVAGELPEVGSVLVLACEADPL
jgi:hypothetical protein